MQLTDARLQIEGYYVGEKYEYKADYKLKLTFNNGEERVLTFARGDWAGDLGERGVDFFGDFPAVSGTVEQE